MFFFRLYNNDSRTILFNRISIYVAIKMKKMLFHVPIPYNAQPRPPCEKSVYEEDKKSIIDYASCGLCRSKIIIIDYTFISINA